ncbi:C-C motif chemokine 3 isoform X2 [Ictalurus punctatus]|uniref:C-C motif chemokine n=1 Tax=Ictalurus punctatus TaxID=7998 RepID=A0A2D0REK8_ICTPU|nr:C-C motif chemokine 3 isoform X2 [Ictalurus punctatus]
MFSRSLLLVLLGLACLQSFTTAQNGNGPARCCFSFQKPENKIPIRVITAYEVTDLQCAKPGVIFTVKEGRKVCADPDVKWVQNLIKKIDKQMYESST